jgi:hypothetical protein
MKMRRASSKIAWTLAVFTLSCSDPTAVSFSSLRFSVQPAGGVAGQPMAVGIEFVDKNGDRATAVNDDVTIALGVGESVSGARILAARNGVATIDDFIVTIASENHVVSATALGLTVVSLPFAVTAGPVNAERSTVAPSADQSLLSNTPRPIVFTFADEYGNPIPRADLSVTSSLSGATLTPAGGQTTSAGTFQTTYRPPASGSARFSAIVNGQSIALPMPLEVINACTPTAVTLPATMTGTLVREQGCLVGGSPFQFYRFTTATSGGLSINIESPFGAEFEVRADSSVPTVRLVAIDTTITRQWLLPEGAYEFRIGAFAGQGTYTVKATAAPANRGDTLRMLTLPGTYTGQTLAAGDFLNSLDSFTDSFAIFSARPCTITVRSTAFDPYIQLTSQFGILIGFDDNSGGGTDAQITRSSCSSAGGAIRIDIASVISGQTGPYTLIITYN